MAKIQNPQDQNGINLVNQETFETTISRLEEVDTNLSETISDESKKVTTIEEIVTVHIDDEERHITANERDSWNKNISSTYNLKYNSKTLIPNEYSVDGTARSGAFTTFILPNNFYPANVQFNSIKIETLNINGTTPIEAYLGVMALYSDGTKKALSISDNTNLSGTAGSPVWYFSTPFTIKEDYKLIFYILKDKESFIEPEPIVDKNVAIGAVVYNTDVLDPYDNWNEAQTNLNFGFIVNGEFVRNNAYPSWPACTLYKLNHVNNQDIHITSEERNKWNKTDKILSDISHITYSNEGYSNDNYALTSGFKLNLIHGGYLENIKVWCHTSKEYANETYLKILDSNNIPVACSENIQSHGMGKILSFNFNNFFVNDNTTYKCIFTTTNLLDTINPISSCITLCNNNKDNAVCPLKAELLNESYNVIGDNLQAIISYTIKEKVGTLISDTILIPESENTNITDEGGILSFKLAKNIDNIVIVSYIPHIPNELESSITVNNEQINVNINKKETTPLGEYYIVIELLYIDKLYKSVKRSYTYSKVTI